MKILILDQHSDVTRSILQQFQKLGHQIFIADDSIIPLKKWKIETLQNNAYHYSFEIGNIAQLTGGEFDAFISLSRNFYKKLYLLATPKTKAIYFNTQPNSSLLEFDNVLSCDSRNISKNSCFFMLTLPIDLHKYHGPDLAGHYIQLIYSFSKTSKKSNRIQSWEIFEKVVDNYNGKRKIISYGDSGSTAKDTEMFPKMFAQLHIKNWGSGNDYAILKGMVRGIPPILYAPFIQGSVINQFIGDNEAFFFHDDNCLARLLEQIDDEYELVKSKGLSASQKTIDFMLDNVHLNKLDQFLNSLN